MLLRLNLSVLVLAQLLLRASAWELDCDYRWKGFCIGDSRMPGSDTYAAMRALYDWMGTDKQRITSEDHNAVIGYESNNVFAYACVNDHNAFADFTQTDVDNAVTAMNLNCDPNQPAWAILEYQCFRTPWYGTEKIIGRSWKGTPICQGVYGGMGSSPGDVSPGKSVPLNVGP